MHLKLLILIISMLLLILSLSTPLVFTSEANEFRAIYPPKITNFNRTNPRLILRRYADACIHSIQIIEHILTANIRYGIKLARYYSVNKVYFFDKNNDYGTYKLYTYGLSSYLYDSYNKDYYVIEPGLQTSGISATDIKVFVLSEFKIYEDSKGLYVVP